jgi:hypothetical protein
MGKREPVLATLDGDDGRTSEELLMIAVLSRAIRDSIGDTAFVDSEKGRNKSVRSAESWLLSTSIQPYSFRWVCGSLNLSHKLVLDYVDELRAAPEFDEIMCCNVKSFKTKIGSARIRTRTGYLLQTIEDRKKKAPRGAD